MFNIQSRFSQNSERVSWAVLTKHGPHKIERMFQIFTRSILLASSRQAYSLRLITDLELKNLPSQKKMTMPKVP